MYCRVTCALITSAATVLYILPFVCCGQKTEKTSVTFCLLWTEDGEDVCYPLLWTEDEEDACYPLLWTGNGEDACYPLSVMDRRRRRRLLPFVCYGQKTEKTPVTLCLLRTEDREEACYPLSVKDRRQRRSLLPFVWYGKKTEKMTMC